MSTWKRRNLQSILILIPLYSYSSPSFLLSLHLSFSRHTHTRTHTDVEEMPGSVILTLHVTSHLILRHIRTLSCSEIRMCPTMNSISALCHNLLRSIIIQNHGASHNE